MKDIATVALALFVVVVLVATLQELRRRSRSLVAARLEARTDDLTGCKNKRDWRERIEYLQTNRIPFSFILFDVANFKAANEILGHVGADKLLQQVAKVIRSEEQPGHRVGGDEFVIALPGGTVAQALDARDRIVASIGFVELAPGVELFMAGAIGTWWPGQDWDQTLLYSDFLLEQGKARTKQSRGLPLSREETLALLGS